MFRCVLLALVLPAVLVNTSPSFRRNQNKGDEIENILRSLEQEEKKSTSSGLDEIEQLLKERYRKEKKVTEKRMTAKEFNKLLNDKILSRGKTANDMKSPEELEYMKQRDAETRQMELQRLKEREMEDEKRSEQTAADYEKEKYTMTEEEMMARDHEREMNEKKEEEKQLKQSMEEEKRMEQKQSEEEAESIKQMKQLMAKKREKLTKKSVNNDQKSSGDILDNPVIDPNSPIAIDIESMIDEKDGKSLKAKGVDMSKNKDIKAEIMDHHLLTDDQQVEFGLKPETDEDVSSRKRNFIKESFPDGELWPYAVIPYDYADSFDTEDKAIIEGAIREMANLTCVQFLPVTEDLLKSLGHDTFIHFIDDWGCYSYVGRATPGKQVVSLMRPYCVTNHIATHEMMHAIGMMHEQSRNDRDNYVRIHFDNLYGGKNNINMMKFDTQDNNAYDLESVMQYSQYSFSNNGKKTIEVKDRRLEFLTDIEEGLRFYDVKDINAAYKCTAHCNTTVECKNGGFINHKCECYCPPGLTGDTCEELVTGAACGGIVDIGEDPVTIVSPNYPNNYTTGSKCVWLLRAPVGYHVSLEIVDMALADNYLNRCYHSLEIRYNLIGQRGPRECGHVKNKNYVTTKDGTPNLMMLIFNSSMAMNRSTDRGFKLTATKTHAICLDSPCLFGDCVSNSNGTSFYCACDQGYTGTLCDTLTVAKEMTCSFENDELCFMNNLEGTELEWTINSGRTPSMNTGPRGAYDGNNYIYVEMTGRDKQYGDAAVLKSIIKFPAGECCLSFWYNMHGRSVNNLTVMGNGSDGNMTMYWNKTGNQGNHWRYAKIDYKNAKDQIFIIAKRGGFYDGDIALDNIKLTPGPCAADPCDKNPCKNNGVCSHNTTTFTCVCHNGYTGDTCDVAPIKGDVLRCTLERDTSCFLSPEEQNDVPWEVVDYVYNGPEKAYEGQYFGIARSVTSTNRYAMAALNSRDMFPGGEYCFTFAYYLKGYSKFLYLDTYKADTGAVLRTNVIRLSTFDEWVKTGYEFDTQQNDAFRFQLIFGAYGNNVLSLDDMSFRSGFCGCDSSPCKNGATCIPGVGANYTCVCSQNFVGTLCESIGNVTLKCSFEINETECFMKNGEDSTKHWTRQTGPTYSSDTGPDQASDGQYYMYLEDTNSYEDQEFVMKIENYNDYMPMKRCFVFDYHMYGESMNMLQVKNSYRTLFTKKGNQGNKWHTAAIEIADWDKPKIKIIGYGSSGYTGDIAIDNLRLQPGLCGCLSNPCNNGGTCSELADGTTSCKCAPNYKGPTCDIISANTHLKCGFESNEICFFTNSKNSDDFDWTAARYSTPSYGTGPSNATEGSYYMYIEASEPRKKDDVAMLSTYGILLEKGPRCLTFKYHMYGTDIGKLTVYGSGYTSYYLYNSNILWTIGGQQQTSKYQSWKHAEINIPETKSKTIAITASVGSGYHGDIAIDDVHLFGGYCGCPAVPTSTTVMPSPTTKQWSSSASPASSKSPTSPFSPASPSSTPLPSSSPSSLPPTPTTGGNGGVSVPTVPPKRYVWS